MNIVKASNAGEAWREAARRVMERGRPCLDDDQGLTELLGVSIEVEDPRCDDAIVAQWGDPAMLEFMYANFLESEPVLDWGYSYGKRLRSLHGVDQQAEILERLRRRPATKAATIGFLDPAGDGRHVPCAIALDLKVRDGVLSTVAFFRSQDAGSKLYADVRSLGALAEGYARELGVAPGPLSLWVVSLHVYDRDRERVRALIDGTTD